MKRSEDMPARCLLLLAGAWIAISCGESSNALGTGVGGASGRGGSSAGAGAGGTMTGGGSGQATGGRGASGGALAGAGGMSGGGGSAGVTGAGGGAGVTGGAGAGGAGGCDPASEYNRNYIGHSATECSQITYECPLYTKDFSNACGCGCEQDASCPKVFDCQPPTPPMCTPDAVAHCPFSGVAQ